MGHGSNDSILKACLFVFQILLLLMVNFGQCMPKAELLQEGILFRTQFPSPGIFIYKKVGFQKN